MYRLHPSWVAVRDLVASGRIGRLVAVDSWFSYFNDDPTNIRNIARIRWRRPVRHRLLQREPVADAVRRRAGPRRRQARARSGDRRRRAHERDPRVRRRLRRRSPARPGPSRISGSTSTAPMGAFASHIPFNVPPDQPTEITLTAGGDPPVAPAFGGPALRRRRPLHGRGRAVRGGDPRRPRRPRSRPRMRSRICGSSSASSRPGRATADSDDLRYRSLRRLSHEGTTR